MATKTPVVPFDSMGIARRGAAKPVHTVYGHVMKGTGHGISPDGLSVALAFLKERFSRKVVNFERACIT